MAAAGHEVDYEVGYSVYDLHATVPIVPAVEKRNSNLKDNLRSFFENNCKSRQAARIQFFNYKIFKRLRKLTNWMGSGTIDNSQIPLNWIEYESQRPLNALFVHLIASHKDKIIPELIIPQLLKLNVREKQALIQRLIVSNCERGFNIVYEREKELIFRNMQQISDILQTAATVGSWKIISFIFKHVEDSMQYIEAVFLTTISGGSLAAVREIAEMMFKSKRRKVEGEDDSEEEEKKKRRLKIKFKTLFSRALLIAAKYGRVSISKFLIDNGAEVSYKGEEALKIATKNKHVGVVDLLIESGAEIDSCDGLFGIAVESGSVQILRILLTNSSPAFRSQQISSSLSLVDATQTEIMNLLAEFGINIRGRIERITSMPISYGRTPYALAYTLGGPGPSIRDPILLPQIFPQVPIMNVPGLAAIPIDGGLEIADD
jgi:hypothetical protein